MKKVIIAIASVLTIALVAGGLYWRSLQGSDSSSDPIDAIPVSAAIVISYPNLTKTWDSFQAQDYYDLFAPIKELERFFVRNELLDSLMRHDEDIKSALANATLWSSFHTTAGDSLAFFHVIKPSNGGTKRVIEAFKKSLTSNGAVSEQQLGETTVIKVVFSNPFRTTYFATENDLILSSSDIRLIEASIAQLRSGKSLKNEADFTKSIEAAGKNVDANIFVNFKKMPAYLKGLFKPEIGGLHSVIGNFASWMELDLNLKSDGFMFNGFSYTNDTLPQHLGLFLNQKPQSITFPDVLPSNTASFLFFGISNPISFASDYKELLDKTGKWSALKTELDSINSLYGIDLEQSLLGWIGNSFGLCITEPQQESFVDNSYLVFETSSAQLAEKVLSDLSTALTDVNKLVAKDIEVNGTTIRQLPMNGMVEKLLGTEFSAYNNPFYVILENHVVFGISSESLASYLQYVQADRTLAKELSYSRFAENLGSTFNVFSYHQIKRSKKILNSYLNNDAQSVLKANPALTQGFEAIGGQITSMGSSFYSSIFVKYNPTSEADKESAWKATISGKAVLSPLFAKNHLSGEPEILVQDETNALYLFNKAGQQLFKTEIAEKIESRPVQVDAFKNGALQYIFNTKNFIYLIDRDGNLAKGYPVKLKAPAQTNLAVLDYDNDLEYRLLITCENKAIYNYDIKGKSVSGWRHNSASDLTVHPFSHLRVSQKDYLITGESNGKIHLLDRTGKNRVTVKDKVEPSANNHLQVFNSTESAFTGIYITDKEGKIHRISLDGKVGPMDLGKFSPEHRFIVSDLDKDGKPEFIFSDLNMLRVFNYKKQMVFEQRIDPSATAPFIIDLGDEGKSIGYCLTDPEQLVLYDAKGEMKDGFPLSGKSDFDVFRSNSGLLVVSMDTDSTLTIQSFP
ncbi:MAG: DUF3352 domain-containing protein [Flavobacteriales bacterium]|nr:DUF3352 domain-containing protein [Flavobacteriales bacterium]